MAQTLRETLDTILQNGGLKVTIFFHSYSSLKTITADPIELLYHEQFHLSEAALDAEVQQHWYDGSDKAEASIVMK